MQDTKALITTEPHVFADAQRALVAKSLPAARAIMLVDPTGFQVCPQSALDNHYMDLSVRVDPERAWFQFHQLRTLLGQLGLPTLVVPGLAGCDDGVFSNNVFATCERRLIIGSMKHEARRREAARTDIRTLFQDGFHYDVVDLSQGPVAELTGVLAIDRPRGAAVCGVSQRVIEEAIPSMVDAFRLPATLVTPLAPEEYHLNIVLAIHAGRSAMIWDAGLLDSRVPHMLDELYEGRVLHLTDEEKNAFAANSLAVTQQDLVMSQTAVNALRPSSIDTISQWGFRLHGVDVTEFEKGGGSLRCLLTEIY